MFEAAQGWGKATQAMVTALIAASGWKARPVHDTDCYVGDWPRFQIERGSELKLGVMLDGVASNGG